eukprot:scaffold43765_cov72-Phaeocystis_antarctica.AAC.1
MSPSIHTVCPQPQAAASADNADAHGAGPSLASKACPILARQCGSGGWLAEAGWPRLWLAGPSLPLRPNLGGPCFRHRLDPCGARVATHPARRAPHRARFVKDASGWASSGCEIVTLRGSLYIIWARSLDLCSTSYISRQA